MTFHKASKRRENLIPLCLLLFSELAKIQCVALLFNVPNHGKTQHKKSSIAVPHHDLDKGGCSI
jgi:hypothetical protein